MKSEDDSTASSHSTFILSSYFLKDDRSFKSSALAQMFLLSSGKQIQISVGRRGMLVPLGTGKVVTDLQRSQTQVLFSRSTLDLDLLQSTF